MIVYCRSANRVDIPIDFVILQLGFHVTQHRIGLSICSNYTLQYKVSRHAEKEKHDCRQMCSLSCWNEGKKNASPSLLVPLNQHTLPKIVGYLSQTFPRNWLNFCIDLFMPYFSFDFGYSLIYLHVSSGAALFKRNTPKGRRFVCIAKETKKWWNWFRQRERKKVNGIEHTSGIYLNFKQIK